MENQPSMKDALRVMGINLGIMLVYYLLLAVAMKKDELPIVFFFVSGLHAFICFVLTIVSFARSKSYQAIGFLISIFMTLLVGFSTCLVTMENMNFH